MVVTRPSPAPLLVLHAIRLLGFADSIAVAHRTEISQETLSRSSVIPSNGIGFGTTPSRA